MIQNSSLLLTTFQQSIRPSVEMGDVSKEAIADVKSTLKVEFPITGLQDFNTATKTWSFNEKKHTIPATCKRSLYFGR